MATFKYFSGSVSVSRVWAERSAWLKTAGAARAYGHFYWCGSLNGVSVPVDRVIEYKSRPSLHVCDARCQNARGHVCECSCGGLNHGRGADNVAGQGVLL